MKKTILTICISLALISTIKISNAQEQKTDKKLYGGAGYFAFRISNYDFKNLNDVLKANNLKEFNNLSVSYGGGGYGIINRLVLGGEGFTASSNNQLDTAYKSSMNLEYGLFKIGYLLINNKKLFIYPSLGIGSIQQQIKIVENTQKDFNQQLSNPKRGIELINDQLLIDLGINGNIYLSKSSTVSLNWQVGYQITSSNANNWRDQTGTIANAPKQSYNAAYAQIGLVFGGFSR